MQPLFEITTKPKRRRDRKDKKPRQFEMFGEGDDMMMQIEAMARRADELRGLEAGVFRRYDASYAEGHPCLRCGGGCACARWRVGGRHACKVHAGALSAFLGAYRPNGPAIVDSNRLQ